MKFMFSWKGLTVVVILLLVLVALLINFRVNDKSVYDPYGDFDFKFNFGEDGITEINTFDYTITKMRTSSFRRKTGYLLPPWARKRIFDTMHSMDIMSYPDSLNDGNDISGEQENFTLVVRMDNVEKTIKWDIPLHLSNDEYKSMSDEQKAFLKLARQIRAIITNSRAFRTLTIQGGFYL